MTTERDDAHENDERQRMTERQAPSNWNVPNALTTLRIVLVGDSTVTDHAGWGQGFKRYLKDGVECVNTAQGGRSSKSFIDEGRLEKAIEVK